VKLLRQPGAEKFHSSSRTDLVTLSIFDSRKLSALSFKTGFESVLLVNDLKQLRGATAGRQF
jgi:hypothetical protein